MMEHSSSSPARPPQRMQPHHLQKVNYLYKLQTNYSGVFYFDFFLESFNFPF